MCKYSFFILTILADKGIDSNMEKCVERNDIDEKSMKVVLRFTTHCNVKNFFLYFVSLTEYFAIEPRVCMCLCVCVSALQPKRINRL